MSAIRRCISCDGYGWIEDDEAGVIDCPWCAGVGYVYHGEDQIDRRIPPEDWDAVSETLERLEHERLREMGYSGTARKPWEQEIRKRK